MQKPTTFFSHSSQDKRALAKLKELFVAKTGGSIDVFMSSDGQSIPFGRNWVHRVEQALDQAKLMLAFVTPNSLRSNWMYFESGYAYSKGVQVVPVGLGVDLSSVGAPLSLLQGFNVTSEAGFNNIIAVANEVFSHSHVETFSSDDYRIIASSSGAVTNSTIGPHVTAIEEIIIQISQSSLGELSAARALQMIAEHFASEQVEHTQGDKSISRLMQNPVNERPWQMS
ncbi:toll/interleukin-1 receptor domain-containing protein [Cognatazoarcus halotolerans]|uniref:toll/interleukin-1 receptor domain-containing protein n=1 Tax=Cognatazoarcus halotolerans TaxID=2686016 RepID=UPI001357285E|nr:toll/interleukin-1 receptor domain-containing protein [Cognatazoarcus halotolerans]MCB1901626.1 toll/interleukin-1 receptor domain-containing protein [Rhodocyclaceae bacterium]MCP5310345.1 toll/interleukin-1 receptor domain-containing protein [Zoogloeaceae bacterium]